eukprot:1094259-Alexandrium_andersonii.AAC.1
MSGREPSRGGKRGAGKGRSKGKRSPVPVSPLRSTGSGSSHRASGSAVAETAYGRPAARASSVSRRPASAMLSPATEAAGSSEGVRIQRARRPE